uniref:Uncharacterized protein n=1 Tax=Rhizophora mucronata TaxID=61149 RepID=A0A2P2JWV9_RHIMU
MDLINLVLSTCHTAEKFDKIERWISRS